MIFWERHGEAEACLVRPGRNEGTCIYLHFCCCWIMPSLALPQQLTRIVPLKAPSIPITILLLNLYIKYNQTLLPKSSFFQLPTEIPTCKMPCTVPSHDLAWPCKLLQTPSPLPREREQKARMILKSFLNGESLPAQQRKTTWAQLLGMLLTQGSNRGRHNHTLPSPLYPSNGTTWILQSVTGDTAQTDFPESVSKTTLKEPHAGVYPSGSAALGFQRFALLLWTGRGAHADRYVPAQQWVLSHTLQVKTQFNFHSHWIWTLTKRSRCKKCGRKRNMKETK